MRLLIIEDEFRTREVLERHFKASKIGLTDIRTAPNGLNGLDIAKEWKPDILLCDVRMPRMDGIQFASSYREIGGKGQLIFLSGYSDKEYLKSAIKTRALNYIEKPINLKEVQDAVLAAVRLVTAEEEKRKISVDWQQHHDTHWSLAVLRQEMVRKLIVEPDSQHVQLALKSKDTFLLRYNNSFTVITAALYWGCSKYPEDISKMQQEVLYQLITRPLLAQHEGICGFTSSQWLVIILPGAFGSSFQEGREKIEDMITELSEVLDPTISFQVGISEPVRLLSDIPLAYQRAMKACNSLFYNEGKNFFFADLLGESVTFSIERHELQQFREDLRKENIDAAKKQLFQLTERARRSCDLHISHVKDVYFQYLMIILEMAIQYGLKEIDGDGERRYIWKEFDGIMNLQILESYVLSFLELFQDSSGEDQVKIREIIRYIHNHFSDKGFTIKTIAEYIGFNETYLSVYFKKQRGQTIKEYINEVRTEQAKILLSNADMKLHEVAVNLGFTDANYFATFFKKTTGCTPTEFREKCVR